MSPLRGSDKNQTYPALILLWNPQIQTIPMSITLTQAQTLATQYFQLQGPIKALSGEVDLNFLIENQSDGQKYCFKIAHAETQVSELEFQNAMMEHLQAAGLGLQIPVPLSSVRGKKIIQHQFPNGEVRYLRALSWVEGRCLAEANPHTPALLEKVGALCGKLSAALANFDHPAAHRWIKWDPGQASWTKAHLNAITDPHKRELAAWALDLFESAALPHLPQLRHSVNYSDANDYNILLSFDALSPEVPGVIDFGDAVFSQTINELAIVIAYTAMDKPDPLAVIRQMTRGYHHHFPLQELEASVLFPLVVARLLISVVCSAQNLQSHPDNVYLQISDRPAWALLQKLRAIPPALVHYAIREACGWPVHPQAAAFVQWAQQHHTQLAPLVNVDLQGKSCIWLDCSVGSAELGTYADIADAERLHLRILETMQEAKAEVAIGRYNEARPFYTTDAYTVQGNEGPQWRSVHIGLDLFMPAGTPVYAPLDGVVHSFQDNAADRDYGPTIILQHQVSADLCFYTLYGHLSRASLEGLYVGKKISKGKRLCWMGPMPENGNWSPHLHFQVMLDMLDKSGDFPGVAFPDQREIWTGICPDPWYLLAGQASPPVQVYTPSNLLAQRQKLLSPNLSISYAEPLYMQRGGGAYLYDHSGRRYLDTVNNVAHVGHEHPRIVRAGQRQMGVLNTNTRYLHPLITQFAEELLAKAPAPLEVAFFVNSGSEANELALRLAKTYTGQKDILALQVGYHGNTNACVEVSSYKFDGPGGKGAAPWVHILPLPDTYRGLYRGNTPESAQQYAQHASSVIAQLQAEGRQPAAFLAESIVSCGGQIPLPPGYLAQVYTQVRAAGGLCIADEVQTGCGRPGAHFWAFEAQGVVPDILTIGKPIGNGHPLAAVLCTREVAAAFANGMEYFNTFGGNPVSCAIGLEVLKVIQEEGLQENAQHTGAYLQAGLQDLSQRFSLIGDVRGTGLFLGIELVRDPELKIPAAAQATYVANRMRNLGILMSTDGPDHNVLKIKPPLVFGRGQADFLLDMLERVLREDFCAV